MTGSISDLINKVVAGSVANTKSASLTDSAVSAALKAELAALGIDSSDIKTASEAQAAIEKAQAKIAAEQASTGQTGATGEIKDTAEVSKLAENASSVADSLGLS